MSTLNDEVMPLTCEFCKKYPATHLLVVDMRTFILNATKEATRLTNLVCRDCGFKGIDDYKRVLDRFMNPMLFQLTQINYRNTGNDLVTGE